MLYSHIEDIFSHMYYNGGFSCAFNSGFWLVGWLVGWFENHKVSMYALE